MSTTTEIVFVEDDPVDAQFFERAVRKADPECRFQRFSDGQAAVNFIEEVTAAESALPCVLVLDIKLPKLLGFEVLSTVRRNPHTRFLPVVMFSGSAQQEDVDRAYLLGANAYLNKPSTMAELNQLVGYLVAFWVRSNRRAVSKPQA